MGGGSDARVMSQFGESLAGLRGRDARKLRLRPTDRCQSDLGTPNPRLESLASDAVFETAVASVRVGRPSILQTETLPLFSGLEPVSCSL